MKKEKKPEISAKTHETYRRVIALCDIELLGKRFEQGERQLDVKKDFFEGEKLSVEQAVDLIKEAVLDDATFNIIGKKSIEACVKAGIVDKNCVGSVAGIQYALSLL